LVDEPVRAAHDKIQAADIKIRTWPIQISINTHYHGDHTGWDSSAITRPIPDQAQTPPVVRRSCVDIAADTVHPPAGVRRVGLGHGRSACRAKRQRRPINEVLVLESASASRSTAAAKACG